MNAVNTNSGGPVVVPKIIDVNILTKSSVTNDHGENLGKIESLMLDLETGKIAYAIVSIGGFPNRTKYFPVPWELLTFSHHDKKLILNVPQILLSKSPGFESTEQILQNADFTWLGEVYAYFSNKVEWEQKHLEERNTEVKRAQQKRAVISAAKGPIPETRP
jgi:sporulation protein YlmC with PRC-barrel domain